MPTPPPTRATQTGYHPRSDAPSCDTRWSALTQRQRVIVQWIGQGYTNRQIASRLTLTDRTVRHHIDTIADTLGMHRDRELRAQIAAWWVRCGERPAA